MGKRIVIKGADFSGNGIYIPNGITLTDADCTIENCGVYAMTGELTNDPTVYYAWSTSDFINIEGTLTLKFVNCGNAVNFGVAFYDSNKSYISGVIYKEELVGTTIVVPLEAKYIRFSDYTGWNVELLLK